tara:strand:+ start:365 stop:3739 length:3375 start_codon:yes stop_codon:yes gene_type:complete
VLTIDQLDEKRAAIAELLRQPAQGASSGCLQLPDDRKCPQSFGNLQSMVLSVMVGVHAMGAMVQTNTQMTCNGLLHFKMSDWPVAAQRAQLAFGRRAKKVVNVEASELCHRLTTPGFGLNPNECLSLSALEHGQMASLCLQRRRRDSAVATTLFALGPHAAYGHVFDATFGLRNHVAAPSPEWLEDELRISVHIRHFDADDTGAESLQTFEEAIREAAAGVKRCAVLLASDRRLTLQLMSAAAAKVGCRVLLSPRGDKERDYAAEHGEDVGEVLLRDVFLLAQGHVLIGTWGSTLTVLIQQLLAARSPGRPPHLPTVQYCDLSHGQCMAPLPLLTTEANAWYLIFLAGIPRIFHAEQADRILQIVSQGHQAWPPMEQTVATLQHTFGGSSRDDGQPQQPAGAWLAAIISSSALSARYVATAAAAASCGFQPVHVQAARPAHYANTAEMILELFGDRGVRHMRSLSAFEVGLLISHKRALLAIANSEHSWGAVFEDDAYLNEAVAPAHAARLLQRTFALASERTLVYTGSCGPQCEAATQPLGGLPLGLLNDGKCHAYCTHSYALSRRYAATFFADVFSCHAGSDICGHECKRLNCYMDWAMTRYFLRAEEHNDSAWVLAGGIKSRWASDHRGLFVQNRSGDNNVSGTALHRRFKWAKSGTVLRQARQHKAGAHHSLRMAAGTAGAPPPPAPLQQLLLTAQWSGRVGNLLFEWAALVGVATRLRAIVPAAEAVELNVPSSSNVPVGELFSHFALESFVRKLPGANASFASVYAKELEEGTACRLSVSENRPNAHDEVVMRGLEAWVASPPPGCRLGLVELVGFFQSWRYFDAAKSSIVLPALAPLAATAATRREARTVLAAARRSGGGRRTKLVGVQVRLGDKVTSSFYSSIYAATGWDYYREAMRMMADALRGQASGNIDVAFLVTAGGSSSGNAADVAEARLHLSGAGAAETVSFSSASDPYVDLAVLRGCDALVIGPSSLGWWAAYLVQLPSGLVVAPQHIFNPDLPWQHKLRMGFREWDYYPPEWLLLPNNGTGQARLTLPKPSVKPRAAPAPPRWFDCQLRLLGTGCRSGARYRSWFTVWSAAPAAARGGCEVRRKSWERMCQRTGVSVETRLVRAEPPK